MIILFSNNVLYSGILSGSKRAISVVIMFWENGGTRATHFTSNGRSHGVGADL